MERLPEEKQIDTVLLTLNVRQELSSQRATASRCSDNLLVNLVNLDMNRGGH